MGYILADRIRGLVVPGPHSAKRVLMALAAHADSDTAENAFASTKRLALESAQSVSNVDRGIRSLRHDGLIVKTGTHPCGPWRPLNVYRIDLAKVDALPLIEAELNRHSEGKGEGLNHHSDGKANADERLFRQNEGGFSVTVTDESVHESVSSSRGGRPAHSTEPPDGSNGERVKREPSETGWRLAGRLRELILENNARAKITPAQLHKWALEVDLMTRRDGRTENEILEVMEWSQRDSFWRANILSAAKLREKFDQLTLRMRGADSGDHNKIAQRRADRVAAARRGIAPTEP